MRRPIPAGEQENTAGHTLPEASEWLDCFGDALYRYALARLRRPQDAEEVVQETLLAALRARSQFQGNAHPLTWLTGILRRKIVDHLRATARAPLTNDANDDNLEVWFDAHGKWRRRPRRWDDPAAAAERSEFWGVVQHCLARLPSRMAAAFTLRTLDEQPPDAVCRELTISAGNLWVLLHRARLQLVRCLDLHWFNPPR
jgi:RNA polymerase sigma-70 factor (ECF subfamily)